MVKGTFGKRRQYEVSFVRTVKTKETVFDTSRKSAVLVARERAEEGYFGPCPGKLRVVKVRTSIVKRWGK